MALAIGQPKAAAAEPIMSAGDAVVTGFSGIRPNGQPPVPGGNPLDSFFINLDGPSAQIQSLGLMGEPPQGQLVSPGVRKQILAKDIGQVFPIALDDGTPNASGVTVPNIYLGATSQFGLHIVKPDADGDGEPDRTKTGAAGATWMPGMFADDKGGSPGAIWRVDGVTGAVTLFSTIPGNAGPGLGDVVYDKATRQFFVSDLDSGLVHRLDANGQLIDTFDHGVAGRPAKGLAAIADNGSKADITSPAFDIEKPDTWGYSQTERRVHGLAVRDGRLFYAVDRQVWSIGIAQNGSFAGDPRWEVDVDTTGPDTQLSDMLFDGNGRIYVAERAAQRGSYDYSLFAEAEKAEVKRYRLEAPDDPATPSRWVAVPETYAIGLPPEHRHSNGGITLGFPYDETGMLKIGSCGQFLWTTGERLRAGEFAQGDAEGDPAANADVHGLQGNPVDLVRPQNVPPMTTYFTDYDQFFGDPEKAGHMGDVEIWQPCEGAPQTFGELPPWWIPPGTEIPPGFPPEFPPPEYPYQTNLELKKRANPKSCWSWGNNWLCRYQIRVRNTGPDNYFGDILVRDVFPANPPGLDTAFAPQPPWFCWRPGGSPAETRCWQPDVFLAPGQSVFLQAWAKIPKDPVRCHLTNVAEIEWAPGGTLWNTDPTDDLDGATAIVPDPRCKHEPRNSNLKLEKKAEFCKLFGNGAYCRYHITVENTGPDNFSGPIAVRDQLPPGVNFFGLPAFNWNCGAVGGNTWECTHKNPVNVVLAPTQKVDLWVIATLNPAVARELKCKVPNRAWIADPLGPPKNTDPTDDSADATADLPPELCREQTNNLRIEKHAYVGSCTTAGDQALCRYLIRVINEGPAPYFGILRVLDTAPPGAQILAPPGPWAFDPQAGNTRLAKLNGVMMPVNSAQSFPIWLRLSTAEMRANDCKIRNVAKIVAAPGGAPNNTNPGDDEDDAWMNGPPEMCKRPTPPQPPTPPQCPPGYEFDDGECVPKGEQCERGWTRTPIRGKCCPPGEPWNRRLGQCGGIEPPGIIDPIPPPVIPPVDIDCPYGWDEVSSTRAHFLRHEGWKVRRFPGLWCVMPPPERPCPPNTEQVPGSRVDILRERDWRVIRVDGKWCGTPPVIQCPRDMRPVPISRVDYLQERRWTLKRLRNGQWCGKPPVIVEQCPDNMREVSRREARRLESKGARVMQLRSGQWCAGEPHAQRCEPPLVGKWPDCRQPPIVEQCPDNMREVSRREARRLESKGARVMQLRSGQWCAGEPHAQRCEPPLVGKWPDCRKPDDGGTKCWNGEIVRHGKQCPPEPCGRGFTGYKPNCKPDTPTCDAACQCKKSGGRWNGETCEHGVKCWDGSTAPSLKQCPPRTQKCPDGSVVPANQKCPVKREPCPEGTVGKYQPNCRKVEVKQPCPEGTVGKYQPNCRKVEVKQPCPPGTVGKFQPNCKRIVKPPKVEPKPPKVEKPARKPCPPGTVGPYQPKCKVVQKQPAKPIFKPGQQNVPR